MVNDTVAIVIPIYQKTFTESELLSIKQLSIFNRKVDIIIVTPKGITVATIERFNKEIKFDKKYFQTNSTYSKLLLSKEFYFCFKEYQYILIYQLDCLVFSSNLSDWCNLGYDYIGAPLFQNKNNPKSGFSRVGNGGLSLRRVDSFLKVLNSDKALSWQQFIKEPLSDRPFWDIKKRISVFRQVRIGIKWYSKLYSLNEDLFWSDRAKLFYPDFKIAPIDIGLKFAFEAHPQYCYEKNNFSLPFGAHAWGKWDKAFWLEKLKEKNYTK